MIRNKVTIITQDYTKKDKGLINVDMPPSEKEINNHIEIMNNKGWELQSIFREYLNYMCVWKTHDSV